MRLPENDRVKLGERILDTVSENAVRQAWTEEAERRIEEIDNGTADKVSFDEMMARIKETRRRGKESPQTRELDR
ncbi:MAG: addiction module protein [Gemmataceae bacterium]